MNYLIFQTAKFDEPVTLDFLDAELENDIKVEVWGRKKKQKKKPNYSTLLYLFFGIAALFSLLLLFFFFFVQLIFWTFGRQIRKKMIDGQTGNYTISTLVKSQDEVICVCDHVRGKGL